MKVRFLGYAAAVLLLAGCGTASVKQSGMAYDPSTQAHMRIYGQNGLRSKAFFEEFAVSAGQGVRVNTAFFGTPLQKPVIPGQVNKKIICCSCVVTFVPQAGQDYEVIPADGALCGIAAAKAAADGTITPLIDEMLGSICPTEDAQPAAAAP